LEIITEFQDGGSKPFSTLFRKLFSEVTGINPRRPQGRRGRIMNPLAYSHDFEQDAFIKHTRHAQELVLLSRQSLGRQRPTTSEVKKIPYELQDSLLSGLVGALEIPGKPTALVTLNPNDPLQLIAVRKPSREMKDPELSDAREAQVLDAARQRLREGVSLTAASPPLPELLGSTLYWREDEYVIRFPQTASLRDVPWQDIQRGSITLRLVEPVPLTLESALVYPRPATKTANPQRGIMVNADEELQLLMVNYSLPVLRRVLFYLYSNQMDFEVTRLSRDGGGSSQMPMIQDAGAYQVLLLLTILYPAALQRVEGRTLRFVVASAPLLWDVRNKISAYVERMTGEARGELSDGEGWMDLGEKRGRVMRPYQVDALAEMMADYRRGRQGSFLWMTVGLGKTKIVLEFLTRLWQENLLPPYVVYALPNSALVSIITELEYYGFPVVYHNPAKKWSQRYRVGGKSSGPLLEWVERYGEIGCQLKPYAVNLIEHDDLRKCNEVLSEYMGEAIFIIDEVHKALNDTLRTAAALNLSYLSQYFIALTGTPVIDNHTYKLTPWLRQIVDFPVNEDNFWVAANAMVAKTLNTGVQVERQQLIAPFSPAAEEQYQSLVPPALGGKNTNPREADIRAAFEICYEVCTEEIIQQTLNYVEQGRGVFVVAKDSQHQQELSRMLIEASGGVLSAADIFLIERGRTLFLTDAAVEAGEVNDYRVVITTIRQAEGYTLTRLNVMITSVYFSNNATREQLEGRINRVSQQAKSITILTIHAGLLTYTLERYNEARNLAAVLKTLTDVIEM
jgi:hypothetical protein